MLTMNNVGVYGMNLNVFWICFMITAIVKPKNKKSIAKAYLDT